MIQESPVSALEPAADNLARRGLFRRRPLGTNPISIGLNVADQATQVPATFAALMFVAGIGLIYWALAEFGLIKTNRPTTGFGGGTGEGGGGASGGF